MSVASMEKYCEDKEALNEAIFRTMERKGMDQEWFKYFRGHLHALFPRMKDWRDPEGRDRCVSLTAKFVDENGFVRPLPGPMLTEDRIRWDLGMEGKSKLFDLVLEGVKEHLGRPVPTDVLMTYVAAVEEASEVIEAPASLSEPRWRMI